VTSVIIENTDVRVSRLSFGTGALHHVVRATDRQRLLAAALDHGFTHFDTSPYYGDGLAEADLGRLAAGHRANRTITTKVGIYPLDGAVRSGWHVWLRRAAGKLHLKSGRPVVDWSVDRARSSLRESLRRLRTDYVDFLFLHEPDLPMLAAGEFLRWLESERERGTIRHWGIAGMPSTIEPWLLTGSALASVVQTRDGVDETTADFLFDHRRKLQFTYGYLAASTRRGGTFSLADVLPAALRRNSHGSILVSTRRPQRLAALASFAP
jgi:aryl-alcohol dehydrogenase-like predicted oxidoreductase